MALFPLTLTFTLAPPHSHPAFALDPRPTLLLASCCHRFSSRVVAVTSTDHTSHRVTAQFAGSHLPRPVRAQPSLLDQKPSPPVIDICLKTQRAQHAHRTNQRLFDERLSCASVAHFSAYEPYIDLKDRVRVVSADTRDAEQRNSLKLSLHTFLARRTRHRRRTPRGGLAWASPHGDRNLLTPSFLARGSHPL